MQHARGFIVGCANGWLWSPGRQSTPNSKLGKLFICKKKNHTISILHTGYKVIGYTFAKQSYWFKLRGLLSKLKAILLVQTARAFVQIRRPRAFQLSPGLLLGTYWLAGSRSPYGGGESHHFTETETQVPAACQPQPRQPHIIKLIYQLQKPTRRITATWIIDTGKRETRYQLVKVHQTFRQPHKPGSHLSWRLPYWTVNY